MKILNHSNAPILAVRVDAVHASPDPLSWSFRSEAERSWPIIAPGASEIVKCLFVDDSGRRQDRRLGPPTIVGAVVSFLDASGLRWERWGTTPPRRLGEVKAPRAAAVAC